MLFLNHADQGILRDVPKAHRERVAQRISFGLRHVPLSGTLNALVLSFACGARTW